MIKHIQRLIFLTLLILLPLHVLAEQADDKLMARVRIKANMKLDGQARKEIAAAAARIKKSSGGTVKLRGIYPSASTAEEYLSKSVFMAREVERYLKTLLPSRQQIYTMTSQFSPEKKGTQNVVEILLYPYELKAAEAEDFKVNTLESQDVDKSAAGSDGSGPVNSEADAGGIRPSEEKSVSSDRSTGTGQLSEDARRAEELVNRVKARAAERAKRKDDTD